MQSINPATGEILASYSELSQSEIDVRMAQAQEAFQSWKETPLSFRQEKLYNLAQILRAKKNELALMATREMGKPITQSLAEVEKCAWMVDYYREEADHILAPQQVKTDASMSLVRLDPLGVVLAVMPWNFPYWQVLRFAVPTILAGNVGVLKHASNVQGCAQEIERIFLQAGFPMGVFQNFAITSSQVAGIVQDVRVRAVTLTGSENAGRQVAKIAGEALKKTVLELGGSDPFIVLESADVVEAVRVAAESRLQNCGQSCISAKRFIVVKNHVDQFLAGMTAAFAAKKIGPPEDPQTELGPLVNEESRKEIQKQVNQAVAQGATLATGGVSLSGVGSFFAPTILTNITRDMDIYHQEVFGPVAQIIVVADEMEAVRVANDVSFGLGCSLWSNDQAQIERIIPQIQAGSVFVNGLVKSDPRLPFGGIKNSGYGRELSSFGLREFVNVKTVWIK